MIEKRRERERERERERREGEGKNREATEEKEDTHPSPQWLQPPRPGAASSASSSSSCGRHSCPWHSSRGTSACGELVPPSPARSTWPAHCGPTCATTQRQRGGGRGGGILGALEQCKHTEE